MCRLTQPRRPVSSTTAALYTTTLTWGGPRLHDLWAANLGGPHVRTSRRKRSTGYTFTNTGLRNNVTAVGWAEGGGGCRQQANQNPNQTRGMRENRMATKSTGVQCEGGAAKDGGLMRAGA